MGSTSYRWFLDGCCECVGSNCVNYGLNESKCLECPLPHHREEQEETGNAAPPEQTSKGKGDKLGDDIGYETNPSPVEEESVVSSGSDTSSKKPIDQEEVDKASKIPATESPDSMKMIS